MEARVLTGTILALTAAVAFALTNAAASLAFSGGSNPSTLAAFRFVLPALVLMAWLAAERRPPRLPKRDAWIAVHGVRRFLHPPEHLQFIGPPARGACLVFITENLDPELIEHSYRRWVVLEGEPDALPRDEIETIQIASESPPMVPVVNQGTAR